MQDATYASLASNLGMLHARGDAAPPRTGNRIGGLGISPYNVYATKDGYVVLNAPGMSISVHPRCDGPFRPQRGPALSHPRDACCQFRRCGRADRDLDHLAHQGPSGEENAGGSRPFCAGARPERGHA